MKSVNTMIQPLTGVNYPLLSLKETLSSVNTGGFFSLHLLCLDYLTYILSESRASNFLHHTGGHHLDRVSSGSQNWYLCGML